MSKSTQIIILALLGLLFMINVCSCQLAAAQAAANAELNAELGDEMAEEALEEELLFEDLYGGLDDPEYNAFEANMMRFMAEHPPMAAV